MHKYCCSKPKCFILIQLDTLLPSPNNTRSAFCNSNKHISYLQPGAVKNENKKVNTSNYEQIAFGRSNTPIKSGL